MSISRQNKDNCVSVWDIFELSTNATETNEFLSKSLFFLIVKIQIYLILRLHCSKLCGLFSQKSTKSEAHMHLSPTHLSFQRAFDLIQYYINALPALSFLIDFRALCGDFTLSHFKSNVIAENWIKVHLLRIKAGKIFGHRPSTNVRYCFNIT